MQLILASKKEIASPPAPLADRNDVRYNWLDNPDIQKLLDVVSEIIANEYIQVAKQNRDVFCKGVVE